MMKKPLSWHIECYHNSVKSLDAKKEQFEKLQEQIEDHQKQVDGYYNQIMSAKQEELDGFDRGKYKAKKLKKVEFKL